MYCNFNGASVLLSGCLNETWIVQPTNHVEAVLSANPLRGQPSCRSFPRLQGNSFTSIQNQNNFIFTILISFWQSSIYRNAMSRQLPQRVHQSTMASLEPATSMDRPSFDVHYHRVPSILLHNGNGMRAAKYTVSTSSLDSSTISVQSLSERCTQRAQGSYRRQYHHLSDHCR